VKQMKVTATKHNRKPKESSCQVTAKGCLLVSETDSVPETLFLSLKGRNPASSPVLFEFGIPHEDEGQVSLAIYDISGREVTGLLGGELTAGYYRASWDPGSNPTGVYLVVLQTEKKTRIKKLVTGGN